MSRKNSVDDIVADYGQVIIDECHHLPAISFERVLSEVKARYVVGLTATPQRRDGHQPIIHMQLGPVRFKADPLNQRAQSPFDHRLVVRESGFDTPVQVSGITIQELYGLLTIWNSGMSLEALLSSYGNAAIGFGTFLEGETILVLGGFAAHRGYLELSWVIVAAFFGTLCGDQLYFYIGRAKGKGALDKRPNWKSKSDKGPFVAQQTSNTPYPGVSISLPHTHSDPIFDRCSWDFTVQILHIECSRCFGLGACYWNPWLSIRART